MSFSNIFSAELLDIITFITCIFSISLMYKFFGVLGLYAYNVIATIVANIQVMEIAKYKYISESMALGTVIFSTIFIVDAIIIEKHGGKYAKQGLFISTSSYLIFIIFMYITMLYNPIVPSITISSSISTLFSTSISIFIASITAYFCSQFFEIHFYSMLKKITNKKLIWMRYNIANALSMLLDQIVFSVLCWKILNTKYQLEMTYIFKNYIIFNYMLRLAISMLATPLAYIIQRLKPLKI